MLSIVARELPLSPDLGKLACSNLSVFDSQLSVKDPSNVEPGIRSPESPLMVPSATILYSLVGLVFVPSFSFPA